MGVEVVALLLLFAMAPDQPGLYSWKPQVIPFLLALPFLFIKGARKPFNRFVYTYSGVCFAYSGIWQNQAQIDAVRHTIEVTDGVTLLYARNV